MAEFISKNNQSIFDVCMQTYGDMNFMYKLIQDSGFPSLSTSPTIGTKFTFDESLINDFGFYNQLQSKGTILNTNQSLGDVFGEEDLQTIFISENGENYFKPEN
jgi:hypothetical protein